LDRAQKSEQVKYITDKFEKAKSVIFADYRGLNVAEITELRSKLSEAESTIKVVKNRLAKRAAAEIKVEGLDDFLTGPTAMASSEVDAVIPAKILVEFAKAHKAMEIKAGYMDGKVLDLATITMLASLPSRDELLSKMLGSINAPITNFTCALAAIPRQLVGVISAIKDTKEQ
jgi:large subunit ribosomal protein L10